MKAIEIIMPSEEYEEDFPVLYADGFYWYIDENGETNERVTLH